MARALSHDARLIVMDEPSAVLDQRARCENLFRVIRDLTAQGVAVVYISHRLEEIRADRRPGHRPQGRPHRRHRPARAGHPDAAS